MHLHSPLPCSSRSPSSAHLRMRLHIPHPANPRTKFALSPSNYIILLIASQPCSPAKTPQSTLTLPTFRNLLRYARLSFPSKHDFCSILLPSADTIIHRASGAQPSPTTAAQTDSINRGCCEGRTGRKAPWVVRGRTSSIGPVQILPSKYKALLRIE